MENNQKPSLTLVPDHFAVNQGAKFMTEMLTWPIYSYQSDTLLGENFTVVYRTVLEALARLASIFEVRISLAVDTKNKRLVLAHRTWAVIKVLGVTALSLNYHTRRENSPYTSIICWLEMEEDMNKPNHEEQERIVSAAAAMSVHDWVKFFQKRIFERATFLENKAQRLRTEGDEFFKSSCLISRAAALLEFSK